MDNEWCDELCRVREEIKKLVSSQFCKNQHHTIKLDNISFSKINEDDKLNRLCESVEVLKVLGKVVLTLILLQRLIFLKVCTQNLQLKYPQLATR